MLKERFGKKAQEGVSSLRVVSIASILAAVSLLISVINPLALAIADRFFYVSGYGGLVVAVIALIFGIVAFVQGQRSVSLLVLSGSLIFFNAAFLFEGELVTLGVSSVGGLLSLIMAVVAVRRERFKDMHGTVVGLDVLLLLLQAFVVYLMIKGRLVAA